MAEALLEIAGFRRSLSRSDRRRNVCYRVAFEHQPFVRLLMALDLPLAAVREHDGDRLFLGVGCSSTAELRGKTVEIFRRLRRRPKLSRALNADLAVWRCRKLMSRRLILFWPGIEIEEVLLH
jgi:hypothetical protein